METTIIEFHVQLYKLNLNVASILILFILDISENVLHFHREKC